MADSLEKNIWNMNSTVLRSMDTVGLDGSADFICETSISSPTWTTFNGDLPGKKDGYGEETWFISNLKIT
jgi:hypothetical protein